MKRTARVAFAVAAIVATVLLAACSSPAGRPFSVPSLRPGDIARVVYTPRTPRTGTTATTHPGVAYDIKIGCRSTNGVTVKYRISDKTGTLSSGSFPCGGVTVGSSAISAGSAPDTVSVRFTSNMSTVTAAYLMLVPSSAS